MEAATVTELRAARKLQQQAEASAKRAAREARRAENAAIHNAKRPRVPSNGSIGSVEANFSDGDSISSNRSPCLRVCVVGLGWYALRAHLPTLAALEARGCGIPGQRIKVVALVSRSTEAYGAAERRLGHSAICHNSLAAALADPQLDVIDLVLPTQEMPAAIAACLAAGKCVISEKPAAPSLVDVATLFAAWRRAPPSAHWSVSEQWGHKPAVVKLRALLDRGAVGPAILGFRFVHEQPIREASDSGRGSWRTTLRHEGSDTSPSLPWLRDVGVHFVRALRTILGPVAAVHSGPTQGAMPVGLELESGVHGTFQLEFPLMSAKNDASEVGTSYRSNDRHGDNTGNTCTSSGGVDAKADQAQFLVWGSKGCLAWDFKRRTIEFRALSKGATLNGRTSDDSCTHEEVVKWRETVGGDPFIEGGVRAALADCLRDAICHRRRNLPAENSDCNGGSDDSSGGFSTSASSDNYSNCSPEAAAHDMAVISAIEIVLSNAKSHGSTAAPVSPPALLANACAETNRSNSSSSDGSRCSHSDFSNCRALLRPGPWLSDASGTQKWQPDLVARCVSTSDVQSAVAWAAAENAALRALPASNTLPIAFSGGAAALTSMQSDTGEGLNAESTAALASPEDAKEAAPLAGFRSEPSSIGTGSPVVDAALGTGPPLFWAVRPLGTAHSWSSYGAGAALSEKTSQTLEARESHPASIKRQRVLCLDLSGLVASPATLHAMPPGRSESRGKESMEGDAVVSLGASAHVSTLAEVALAHGYSIASLPMLHAQTLGGAVAVGSHGSSLREGTLSDQVVGLSMVLADGSLVHLGRQVDSSLVTKKGTYEERIGTNTASACATAEWARCAGFSDNDERCSEGRDALLLRCARVAVGTLGIITRISMRCENARYVMKRRVEAHVPVATWATAVASRSGCVDPSGPFGCAEHAMAVWCLGQSEIATCCLETSEADGKSVSSSIGGDVREGGEELRAQFVVGDKNNSSRSDCSDSSSSSNTHFGVYNGRNWYKNNNGSEFIAPGAASPLTEKEVATQGLVWQSLQYTFPISKLERTIALLTAAAADPSTDLNVHSGDDSAADISAPFLRGRVVEFKFLRCSNAALLGPNSTSGANDGKSSESTDAVNAVGSAEKKASQSILPDNNITDASNLAFAVNVYWPLPRGDTRALAALEDVLRAVGGGRPHWGKFHSPCQASKALPDVRESETGLLQGWLRRAFPKEAHETFEKARRAADPEGLFCPH